MVPTGVYRNTAHFYSVCAAYVHALSPLVDGTPGHFLLWHKGWTLAGWVPPIHTPWYSLPAATPVPATTSAPTSVPPEGRIRIRSSSATAEMAATATASVASAVALDCPGGHGLSPFVTAHARYRCDSCQGSQPSGVRFTQRHIVIIAYACGMHRAPTYSTDGVYGAAPQGKDPVAVHAAAAWLTPLSSHRAL